MNRAVLNLGTAVLKVMGLRSVALLFTLW